MSRARRLFKCTVKPLEFGIAGDNGTSFYLRFVKMQLLSSDYRKIVFDVMFLGCCGKFKQY